MRKIFLLVPVVLVLTMAPALAGGPVDVADESGFGSLVVDPVTSASTGFLGFTLTVETSVWLKGGTYTYVYQISDVPPGGTLGTSGPFGISSVAIGSSSFDGDLNWGTVGGGGSNFLMAATFNDNLTFHFSPLPTGTSTSIYAQSTQGPLEYNFWGTGYGPSGNSDSTLGPGADALAHAPEPGTLILLGTGLLFGAGYLRKKLVKPTDKL